MKATYTAHGETVSIETEHDDVTVAEAIEVMVRLLVAAGFSEFTVRDWIAE